MTLKQAAELFKARKRFWAALEYLRQATWRAQRVLFSERDDCDLYAPGQPQPGTCGGDGHYACQGCVHWDGVDKTEWGRDWLEVSTVRSE